MTPSNTLEVWLRGPLPDMPPLLQPIAHALMQAREEVNELLHDFPDTLLWERPAGRNPNGQPAKSVASVGFHVQHLTGVLDRLFTYARGQALSPEQLTALATEGNPMPPIPTVQELVRQFGEQVERALAQLRSTNEQTLPEAVGLGGRNFLPRSLACWFTQLNIPCDT